MIISMPILERYTNFRYQYIESIKKLEDEFKAKKIYSEDLYEQSLVKEYRNKLKENIEKK
ncbi:hypothetical protein [Caldicellulosiruptor naganoensis]|uniref:Uncharacterized protein n=1 Tax=Caldicellulosiruptor naganoensis TaxID=29324 RepID=A0ABY7BI99_9FIRM|nr:hypothetical protein [Caldicellulosiruptor naganoensis]WAM32568.1 hypothetical protein OTJ99_001141 [Caldicellulosiruptor naganoensis]